MDRTEKNRACPHTDRPIVAKGLCNACYVAQWKRGTGRRKKHIERISTEVSFLNESITQLLSDITELTTNLQLLKDLQGKVGN